MSEKMQLTAEKRVIVGRKVKTLRNEGLVPASVYGKKVKSLSLQLNLKDFSSVLSSAGETSVINLSVKGEDSARPVLIHQIQKHPVTDKIISIDFYQVDLKEKVTVKIPVEIKGGSPVVGQQQGILIQPANEVEVEALPNDLPEKFEIEVSSLTEVGQAITVENLKVPQGVTVLTPQNQVLAKIEPLAAEEVAPAPVVEETPTAEGEVTPEGGEAAPAGETTEEKAPSEG